MPKYIGLIPKLILSIPGLILPNLSIGASKTPARPNVLFIAVDDLRPDLGCYGNKEVKSPNIDRLASDGLLFQRVYCQLAHCSPSRASLLSGIRPENIGNKGRSGVTGNVPKEIVTLPRLFRNMGYETVSIGKVYHVNNDDEQGWVRRYTDTFLENVNGYCSGYQLTENKERTKNRESLRPPLPNLTEITYTPDGETPDGIIARRAIEELRKFKSSNQPFFLATGFYRPHMPLTAPKKYWEMYDRNKIMLPDNFNKVAIPPYNGLEMKQYGDTNDGRISEEKAREIIHGYRASITFVDVQIGKVLQELHRLGLEKNTIVVLFSDNGFNLGEHGRWSKLTNCENSTHVVLMLKVPGQKGGQITPALTELVDIYPTLAELCKLPIQDYLEGTSLVPILQNPQREWKKAVFSCLYDPKALTVRTDRYRLIEHPDGQIELYDHQSDPAEDNNLALDPSYSNTLKELQTVIKNGWSAAKPNVITR